MTPISFQNSVNATLWQPQISEATFTKIPSCTRNFPTSQHQSNRAQKNRFAVCELHRTWHTHCYERRGLECFSVVLPTAHCTLQTVLCCLQHTANCRQCCVAYSTLHTADSVVLPTAHYRQCCVAYSTLQTVLCCLQHTAHCRQCCVAYSTLHTTDSVVLPTAHCRQCCVAYSTLHTTDTFQEFVSFNLVFSNNTKPSTICKDSYVCSYIIWTDLTHNGVVL